MEAVKQDKDFDLVYDNEVYQTVKAKNLWDKIISHAHSSAEPVVILGYYERLS